MDEVRKAFHQELDEIRQELIRMGGMVTELIPRGTQILLDGDLAAADELIQGDDDLDLMALEIDEHTTRILARQNPVASDLRAVLTAIHLVSEIERSGDLVVNIAKGARRLHGVPLDPQVRGFIGRMGEEAQKLMQTAIDAYADVDGALGAALDDMDDAMDELHGAYVQAIFESRASSSTALPSAVQLALIGRYYERIGDHAVNIGERVAFLANGWLPEHTGAARARARAQAGPAASSGTGATALNGNGEPGEEP